MSSYLEAVEVFDAQHQAWSMLKMNGKRYLLFKRASLAAEARN